MFVKEGASFITSGMHITWELESITNQIGREKMGCYKQKTP